MIQFVRAYFVRRSARASSRAERWDAAAGQYTVLRRIGQARPSDVVREARAVEDMGQLQASLALHDENVALFPLSVHVRRQRALALLRRGKDDEARLELAQARVLIENDKAQEMMLVTELERMGVSEDDVATVALAAFHAAPPPRPAPPGRLTRFRAQRIARAARNLRQAGDWAGAITLHEQVLALYPENGPIHIRQGHALKATARPLDAERSYWRGVALAPADPDGYLQLGHALKLNRGKSAALPAYLLAHAIRPDYQDLSSILADYELPASKIATLSDTLAKASADRIVGPSGLLESMGSQPLKSKDASALESAGARGHSSRHPLPRYVEVRAAAIAGDIGRAVGARL